MSVDGERAVLASLDAGFKLFLGIVAFVASSRSCSRSSAERAAGRSRIGPCRQPLRAADAPRGDRAVPDLHHGRELVARAATQIAARPPTLFPSRPAVGQRTATRGTRALSARTCATASSSPCIIVAGQLVTSILAGVRVRVPRVPVQADHLRAVPRDADDPVRGRVLHEPRHRLELGDIPGIGKYIGFDTYGALVVPFLATGFGAFLIRQAFLALPRDLQRRGRARRLRPLAVHDAGRGAARPADGRRARAVLLLRGVEPVPVAAGRDRGREPPDGAGRAQAPAGRGARPDQHHVRRYGARGAARCSSCSSCSRSSWCGASRPAR